MLSQIEKYYGPRQRGARHLQRTQPAVVQSAWRQGRSRAHRRAAVGSGEAGFAAREVRLRMAVDHCRARRCIPTRLSRRDAADRLRRHAGVEGQANAGAGALAVGARRRSMLRLRATSLSDWLRWKPRSRDARWWRTIFRRFRELWGETACYFPTNDADGLRDAIAVLRNDRMLRRQYAELAYQTCAPPLQRRSHGRRVSGGVPVAERKEEHGGMRGKLRFRIFAHSWISDWNHGNAHFLRGLARELVRTGPRSPLLRGDGSWSLTNLMREGEIAQPAIEQFRREFPDLDVRFYQRDATLQETLADGTARRRHRDHSRME